MITYSLCRCLGIKKSSLRRTFCLGISHDNTSTGLLRISDYFRELYNPTMEILNYRRRIGQSKSNCQLFSTISTRLVIATRSTSGGTCMVQPSIFKLKSPQTIIIAREYYSTSNPNSIHFFESSRRSTVPFLKAITNGSIMSTFLPKYSRSIRS